VRSGGLSHNGVFRQPGDKAFVPPIVYVDAHNERGTPFKWVKTADEILDSMRRFDLRVQQVHGQ
jgi:hypothetical protein